MYSFMAPGITGSLGLSQWVPNPYIASDLITKQGMVILLLGQLPSSPYPSILAILLLLLLSLLLSRTCGLPISLAHKDNNTLFIICAFPCGKSSWLLLSARPDLSGLYGDDSLAADRRDNPLPPGLYYRDVGPNVIPMAAHAPYSVTASPVIPNLQKRPTPELHRTAWALIPVQVADDLANVRDSLWSSHET